MIDYSTLSHGLSIVMYYNQNIYLNKENSLNPHVKCILIFNFWFKTHHHNYLYFFPILLQIIHKRTLSLQIVRTRSFKVYFKP